MAEKKVIIYSIEESEQCWECPGYFSSILLCHERRIPKDEFNDMVAEVNKIYYAKCSATKEYIRKHEFVVDMLKTLYGFKPYQPYIEYDIDDNKKI